MLILLSVVVHVVFPNFLIYFYQKLCIGRKELRRQLHVCKHTFLNLSDRCTSLVMPLIDQHKTTLKNHRMFSREMLHILVITKLNYNLYCW